VDSHHIIMEDSAVKDIVCAHSPDSDDAYMFYALATRKLRSPLVNFVHRLEDIQTLNAKAREGVYDLTAISYHAFPYVFDKYQLMASGSSVGDGYGPMLVSPNAMGPEELKGKRIAVPGKLTTAYLTMRICEPDFEAVVVPFDEVLNAVSEKRADAALVIHEAQLTYSKGGFHKILDLGVWWKKQFDLPLPLGANAILRSLPADIKSECCKLMRESIRYALDNQEEALNYAMQFARDMEQPLAEKFVGMYVNHYTEDCGELIPRAAQKLLDLGFEQGIIPHRVELEFVR
jgi:1,4-dihydroxy-6-naphthoate synthase